MKKTLLFEGSSIIIGTVVGAGILGLPFAFVKAGFLTGLLVLVIISACVIVLSLFFGEVTLRTKGNHQLTGYTGRYLGNTAKHLQAIILLFGMYSALLAYTIGIGKILSSLFSGSAEIWSLGAYFILSWLVILGLKVIKRIEFVVAILILGLLFVLGMLASPHVSTIYWQGFSLAKFFIPYGAILFACSGLVAIPEAKQIISQGRGEKLFKSAIIIGNLVPLIIYAVFATIVVAVTGANTTEIATIGLTSVIGLGALIIGSFFAVIAMSSSFMTLGVAIKEIFQYDYKLSHAAAALGTLAIPIVAFIFGLRDFFGIVTLAGALSVGLTGLLSVATFWRARRLGQRQPEYIIPNWFAVPASLIIVAMFIAGLVYTIN
jgi:tyrosine-specific transport protein